MNDFDALAELNEAQVHLSRVKAAAFPLVEWFGSTLIDYAQNNGGAALQDKTVLLYAVTGKGKVADCVTAGDIRKLIAAIHPGGQE